MILDASFLISVDREELAAKAFIAAAIRRGTPLRSTHPVVAQVWRNGARQARLAQFLNTVEIHPFDDGHGVGSLLARSGTSDVVDAHLVSSPLRTMKQFSPETSRTSLFWSHHCNIPDHEFNLGHRPQRSASRR